MLSFIASVKFHWSDYSHIYLECSQNRTQQFVTKTPGFIFFLWRNIDLECAKLHKYSKMYLVLNELKGDYFRGLWCEGHQSVQKPKHRMQIVIKLYQMEQCAGSWYDIHQSLVKVLHVLMLDSWALFIVDLNKSLFYGQFAITLYCPTKTKILINY